MLSIRGDRPLGREPRAARLHAPQSREGPRHGDKPAMWVDANVHGNEVQGSEVGGLHWLGLPAREPRSRTRSVTELVDRSPRSTCSRWSTPTVAPIGSSEAPTPPAPRARACSPTDSDGDGLAGRGSGPTTWTATATSSQMRKHVPGEGTHRLNRRRSTASWSGSRRTTAAMRGDWILLRVKRASTTTATGASTRTRCRRVRHEPLVAVVCGMPRARSIRSRPLPAVLAGVAPRSPASCYERTRTWPPLQSFHNAGGMILRWSRARRSFGSVPAPRI